MSSMQNTTEQARPVRQRRRVPVPVVVAVIVFAGVGLWLRSAPAKQAPAADAAAAAAPLELAPADVAAVSMGELSSSLPLSGSLSPLVQTTIKSRVAGEVLEFNVREGQAVKRGQVLARVDTRISKAQLDSQQAALEKARADLSLAKLNRDNSATMLKEHFISQNAYDSAESTYEADLATAKSAEAQVRLAQITYDDAVITAPFDGTVSSRLAEPGERIEVDTSLLALVDLSQMEWQAPAPASEIPSVHVGQMAHFKVGGFGDRQFEGRVERINPITETGSRSIMVYLSVPNPDNALHGGMFAEGSLLLDRTAPTPSMPSAAVHSDSGVDYAYQLAGGKIYRRQLELGLRSEDQGTVEVRGGLKPGDQVIIAPIDAPKDGTLAVVKAPTPAAKGG
jgi:membrane fusion protein, multidrug efflux system